MAAGTSEGEKIWIPRDSLTAFPLFFSPSHFSPLFLKAPVLRWQRVRNFERIRSKAGIKRLEEDIWKMLRVKKVMVARKGWEGVPGRSSRGESAILTLHCRIFAIGRVHSENGEETQAEKSVQTHRLTFTRISVLYSTTTEHFPSDK